MLNSLSEETFELDFVKLFIKVKILLLFSINKTKIIDTDIDIISDKYIEILDLKNKEFDPFLIKNFMVLDDFLNKNFKKELGENSAIINFQDTFYIASILYITNMINEIIKIINEFEDLKIRLLKLKNSIMNIEIRNKLSLHLLLKSVFSENDRFIINLNSDTPEDSSKLIYIIQQLNFVNNAIKTELTSFSKFNLNNILLFMDNIYNSLIKIEDLFISFFYIFKYLKIILNLFTFITQLK